MSSRGSWSRRGPGETRACWRRRALDSDSTLDSISVGLVAGTVTPNWPWERKRSQLSGAGERRCTSVASSCGPPSWAAWSEVWMPRASFEVTGGWGWVRCLATWLNVGQTLAQPRLQSLECGRVQKRKTSNQQPATSNQQPATNHHQHTRYHQLLPRVQHDAIWCEEIRIVQEFDRARSGQAPCLARDAGLKSSQSDESEAE